MNLPRAKTISLTGFGRSRAVNVPAYRPERVKDVSAILTHHTAHKKPLLVHAGGRSYGDSALPDNGAALLTTRLNRFVAFDETTGDLVAEPGITCAEVLETFLPQGWLLPVTPGTGFATLGGCVAADVHGKNHHHAGSFGAHVQWLEVALGTGETKRISPIEHPDIFNATLGGMGLTGIITAVCVRLQKVNGNGLTRTRKRMKNLDDFIHHLSIHQAMPYSVGWVDALATGKDLGRGILELATPTDRPVAHTPRRVLNVPFTFPNFVLNPYSVKAFNAFYYNRVSAAPQVDTLAYDRFFYPLDAIHNWSRLYGVRGFYQFQCVLPAATGGAGLVKLLDMIAQSKQASFLAVLKTLGEQGTGLLSFPLKGYTLALDFPKTEETAVLIRRLYKTVLEQNGRVYLAKDALLDKFTFQAMYQQHAAFTAIKKQLDPQGVFTSLQAKRLGLAGDV